MNYLFFALFLLDAGLHLFACTPPEKHPLRRVSKCLLMPLLIGWYCTVAPEPSTFVILALFFGFLGDVFLIVPERSWLFVSGLISFAIGHTCYIAAFMQRVQMFPPAWVTLLAIVLYAAGIIGMIYTLWPRLPKNMFLPCVIYMALISLMSLSSFVLALQDRTISAWAAFVGSLLFLASDSVLSIVTFKRRIPYRYLIVMSTYILAQALLAASFAVFGG